jgi:SAM-dependent methyltransferase
MSKRFSRLSEWCSSLTTGDRWEAPERGFVGHRDIIIQSRARYEFVASRVHGSVLDVGCGRGYGFEIIAPRSNTQVGIDISMRFVMEAKLLFPQIFVACGSGEALPFTDHCFESIIAFEVLEHAQNGQLFLEELRRIAHPKAFVAISTPNRLVASGDSVSPLNRFHHHEYEADELYHLLTTVFSAVELFGQHERVGTQNSRNKIVDRVPIRWKYYVPHLFQTLMSVALRPPLRIEDCQFRKKDLEQAHTLLALCRP